MSGHDANRCCASICVVAVEVAEQPHFHYTSFRVCGKIFVTSRRRRRIHVFVPDQAREVALTLHPEFVEKLLWGGKVVGVRIRLSDANPEVVQQLIRRGLAGKGPEKLAAQTWFAGHQCSDELQPLRPDTPIATRGTRLALAAVAARWC